MCMMSQAHGLKDGTALRGFGCRGDRCKRVIYIGNDRRAEKRWLLERFEIPIDGNRLLVVEPYIEVRIYCFYRHRRGIFRSERSCTEPHSKLMDERTS